MILYVPLTLFAILKEKTDREKGGIGDGFFHFRRDQWNEDQ